MPSILNFKYQYLRFVWVPATPVVCANPSFSLVAGDNVQEVQEVVEECVSDFIKLCKENGHQVPAGSEAPSMQSPSKQDGFKQLLTVRVPGLLRHYN